MPAVPSPECTGLRHGFGTYKQEIQLHGASMHAHVLPVYTQQDGETDPFAGTEELHEPNVRFLAVYLDLGGRLDLVLQECPCTHAAISRAECAAQRWGATS